MIALDVVVPTLANAERSDLLWRALDSIQSQSDIRVRPIVVINGARYDRAILRALEQRQGVLLHFVPEPSVGCARMAGLRLATAEFLSFLDDDDVFVQDALLTPLTWLADHSDCDVVVTNRYLVVQGVKFNEILHLADHVDNPALSLLDENWLSPGASFFRVKSVPPKIIDPSWGHQEWTRLAFELCALGKRLHFMDVPTAIYNDTPASLSKQPEHQHAALNLLEVVKNDTRLDIEVRKKAERKYHNTLHVLAMKSWEAGQASRAWQYHLASMRPPYTLKYLLFSRKLLWPASASNNKAVKPV